MSDQEITAVLAEFVARVQAQQSIPHYETVPGRSSSCSKTRVGGQLLLQELDHA